MDTSCSPRGDTGLLLSRGHGLHVAPIRAGSGRHARRIRPAHRRKNVRALGRCRVGGHLGVVRTWCAVLDFTSERRRDACAGLRTSGRFGRRLRLRTHSRHHRALWRPLRAGRGTRPGHIALRRTAQDLSRVRCPHRGDGDPPNQRTDTGSGGQSGIHRGRRGSLHATVHGAATAVHQAGARARAARSRPSSREPARSAGCAVAHRHR